MADATYQPKVYHKRGGDETVVADGGKITVEDGGAVVMPVREVTVNTTLDASESGLIVLAGAADLVITLPSTAAGLSFTFILENAALSTGTGLSISPAAADAINGNGLTSVDNKDLILAGSGDREGDMVTLVADGVDGWYITSAIGTWSKEA